MKEVGDNSEEGEIRYRGEIECSSHDYALESIVRSENDPKSGWMTETQDNERRGVEEAPIGEIPVLVDNPERIRPIGFDQTKKK